MKTRVIAALAAALLATGRAASAAPLTIDVMQTSEASLYTSITLVKGEKGAVLVDAPFTRADAHRVVGWILDSGRTLEAVLVTHDHPDHFFSMEVITQAFPNAKVYAAPVVVDDIWKSIPAKMKRWAPVIGPNAPRYPTAPEPLTAGFLLLEGERIEILGPVQGDHVHCTFVNVPSAKAVIAGDLLFNQMHLWNGESLAPARQSWLASLDRIAATGATRLVAGHKKPGMPDDASSLAFTRDYLQRFEKAVAEGGGSKAVIAKMRAAYPQALDFMGDFLVGNSSRVATGEEPPWQE
jgi:glyoxylase-like metal-dependent hydrolase (beta-lactamase superfamily II)